MNSTTTTAHAATVDRLHRAADAIRRGGYAVPRRLDTLDEARAWTRALYPTAVGTPAVVGRFRDGVTMTDAELEAVAAHLDDDMAAAWTTLEGRDCCPSPDPVEDAAIAGETYMRTADVLRLIRAEQAARLAICWPH